MSFYGIKVSKPGDDVKTVAEKDLQFSSDLSTLKIYTQGDTSVTTNGSGNATITITHNLGYAPAHYVWVKHTASDSYLDASTYANSFSPITNCPNNWFSSIVSSESGLSSISAYTTTTTLVINISGASASTTYYFRYYIFVDNAQQVTGSSSVSLTNDYGFKISKAGYDVKSAPEHQMVYSQKYKSLQYYEVSYKTQDLTLPYFFSSRVDGDNICATYVDFTHGLGYQPFWLAFATNASSDFGTDSNVFVPYMKNYGNVAANLGGYTIINGFCDSTRVRISFTERSITTGTNNGPTFQQRTVKIKVFIFTENLAA